MTLGEYVGLRKAAFEKLKQASPDRRITLREQLAEIDKMLPRQASRPNPRTEAA